MEHAKRLYLIDEFECRYKQLQHSARSIAEARSANRLNDMLRNENLVEHEKVHCYVAELHRYLNVNAPGAHQLQLERRAAFQKCKPIKLTTDDVPVPRLSITTRQQLREAAAAVDSVDSNLITRGGGAISSCPALRT